MRWALIFLVVTLMTGILAYAGVPGAAAGVARVLFWPFAVAFVILLIRAIIAKKKLSSG